MFNLMLQLEVQAREHVPRVPILFAPPLSGQRHTERQHITLALPSLGRARPGPLCATTCSTPCARSNTLALNWLNWWLQRKLLQLLLLLCCLWLWLRLRLLLLRNMRWLALSMGRCCCCGLLCPLALLFLLGHAWVARPGRHVVAGGHRRELISVGSIRVKAQVQRFLRVGAHHSILEARKAGEVGTSSRKKCSLGR